MVVKDLHRNHAVLGANPELLLDMGRPDKRVVIATSSFICFLRPSASYASFS